MFLNLIFTLLYAVNYSHNTNHHYHGEGKCGEFRSIHNRNSTHNNVANSSRIPLGLIGVQRWESSKLITAFSSL